MSIYETANKFIKYFKFVYSLNNKKNDKFIIWIIKFSMATMMYYLDYF